MRDDELTELLQEGVDAHEPPPDRVARFKASLRDRIDAELKTRPTVEHRSEAGPAEEIVTVEIPSATGPGTPRPRRWFGAGLAVAGVVMAIAGIVVATRSDDTDQIVVGEGPPLDASVLPDAVVQDGDPGITVGSASPQAADDFWSFYDDEQAAYEDAGFVDGLTVEFAQDNPLALTPASEVNAAHRFEDAEGAAQALAVLEAWHRDKPAVTFGHPSMAATDLEVDVGDEAVAFVQTRNAYPAGQQGVVILWRNKNVVHVLRAGQLGEEPEGIESVIRLAEAIDARMSA